VWLLHERVIGAGSKKSQRRISKSGIFNEFLSKFFSHSQNLRVSRFTFTLKFRAQKLRQIPKSLESRVGKIILNLQQ